jgi:hypothetical protein
VGQLDGTGADLWISGLGPRVEREVGRWDAGGGARLNELGLPFGFCAIDRFVLYMRPIGLNDGLFFSTVCYRRPASHHASSPRFE